jgi:drug/metabolite transporter (DMT)-like permease
MGATLGLVAAFLFGISSVIVRIGLQELRSSTGTMVSLVSGLCLVMTLALIFHWDAVTELSGESYLWFMLSGLLNFPMGRFMNFSSVQRIGVSRATPVVNSAPLFAAAFAILILGEEMTFPLFLGTVSVMAGIALIVSQR